MEVQFEVISENPIFRDIDTKRGQKQLRRLYSKAMRNAMVTWHRRNIKKHFQNQAMSLYYPYRLAYNDGMSNRKTPPLVLTGTLKKNITSNIKVSMPNGGVKETVIGKMRIGRPGIVGTIDKRTLEKMILAEIEKKRISYKEAKRNVLQKNSYSRKSKELFQNLIGVLNKAEQKTFAKMVLDYVIKHYKFPKRKQTKKEVFK